MLQNSNENFVKGFEIIYKWIVLVQPSFTASLAQNPQETVMPKCIGCNKSVFHKWCNVSKYSNA